MKKLLSALLAAVLAVGLLPAAALAEEPLPEPQEEEYEEEYYEEREEEHEEEYFDDEDDGDPLIEAPRLMIDVGTDVPEGLFSLRQTSTEQYVQGDQSFTFELEVDNSQIIDPNMGDQFEPGVANLEFALVLKNSYGHPIETSALTELVEVTSVSKVAGSPIANAAYRLGLADDRLSGSLSSDVPVSGADGKTSYLSFTVKVRDSATVYTGLNQDYGVYLSLTAISYINPESNGSQTLYSFRDGSNIATTEAGTFTVTPETPDFRVFARLVPSDSGVVSPGQTFTVDFYLDRVNDGSELRYACVEGGLVFDADVLTVAGITWRSFSEDDVYDASNLDLGKIAFALTEPALAGTDPVFTVTFQADRSLGERDNFDVRWEHTAFSADIPGAGEVYEQRVIAAQADFSVDTSTIFMTSAVNHEVLMLDDELVVTLTIPAGVSVRELTGTLDFDRDVLTFRNAQFGWTNNDLSTSYNPSTGQLDVHTITPTYFYPIPENTAFLTLTFDFNNAAARYDVEGTTRITWTQSSFLNDTLDTSDQKTNVALEPVVLRVLRICLGNVNNDYRVVNGEYIPIIDVLDVTLLAAFELLPTEEAKLEAIANHGFVLDGSNVVYYNINACVSGGAWYENRIPTPGELNNLLTYVGSNGELTDCIAPGYDNID